MREVKARLGGPDANTYVSVWLCSWLLHVVVLLGYLLSVCSKRAVLWSAPRGTRACMDVNSSLARSFNVGPIQLSVMIERYRPICFCHPRRS